MSLAVRLLRSVEAYPHQADAPGAIPEQIDRALARLQPAAGDWRRIKLYNAGSFFDPGAIPPEDHPAIATRARRFERVIVECHPALVNEAVLRFRDLVAPARLEVAMGLETAHERTLAKLNKGMTLEQFGRAADFLRRNSIALRSFTMLQPPFLSDPAQALLWSERTLNFAFDCGASVAVIIPTRGGAEAMDALARTGQFVPPALATLETAMEQGCGLRRGRVFADLWDLERFSTCPQCFPARAERIQAMNHCQSVPPRITCQVCGAD